MSEPRTSITASDAIERQRGWVAGALSRYWPAAVDQMRRLPIPAVTAPASEALPPRVEVVPLPEWASDIGVSNGLLVPAAAIAAGHGPASNRTDWWYAADWFLNGHAERAYEAAHGPIHSYSIRLNGWDSRLWEHAWVNRIALLLRRLAARTMNVDEEQLCGPLPPAQIVLTHDVDAVRKSLRIRIKQGGFHAFNAIRAVGKGNGACAVQKAERAARFLLSRGDYWTFDRLCSMEAASGFRSTFHVFAGTPRAASAAVRYVIDPAYDLADVPVARQLRTLHAGGWTIGLHPSFDTWANRDDLRHQKEALERVLGAPVTECRQHWLRFSWESTWSAQESAGIELDSTLGFNDRPGFRNGAALRFSPLSADGSAHRLQCLPLVLMDSHLYDYGDPCATAPEHGIIRWLNEVRAVRGAAAVLWHPHTLSGDYGWLPGYEVLLRELS